MRFETPEKFISDILLGGVWHTTTSERFQKIGNDGFIRVEPQIPDNQRHKTGAGPTHYPFVRWIGGVSLFDFREFDPQSYSIEYPMSTWRVFIPALQGQDQAHWLKFDLAELGTNFVGGADLLTRWKDDEAFGHTIMPKIEAAHLGDISTDAVVESLLVSTTSCGWSVAALDLQH